MVNVSVHQAKTQLSKLLRQVAEGRSIVIENRGRPVARLVPYEADEHAGQRIWGRDTDKVIVHSDFDAPLPDDIGVELGL